MVRRVTLAAFDDDRLSREAAQALRDLVADDTKETHCGRDLPCGEVERGDRDNVQDAG